MKAIILAAGYGTRLYPLTKNRAKAMLPIRGKPIIEHIVSKVHTVKGIDEIIIVTNHQFFHQFRSWAQSFVSLIPLRLVDDGVNAYNDRLGALNDLLFVCEQENIAEDVLVIGGDNLFSFSLEEFVRFTQTRRTESVIGLFNMNGKYRPARFGVAEINDQNRVVKFYEKPQKRNGSTLVSMCFYFFPARALPKLKEYVNADNNVENIGSCIEWLIRKESVYGYTFNGEWVDVGDADSYTDAVFTF
jgi:glucose-1-phosphate thymidylyltransferase